MKVSLKGCDRFTAFLSCSFYLELIHKFGGVYMIEWLALPAAIMGAALLPKAKMKDTTKIEKVFRNLGIAIKGDPPQYPKLVAKTYDDISGKTTYKYSLPFGIPSAIFKKLQEPIAEALNKEVEYEHKNGYLLLYVFENPLPDKWDFSLDLIREGTWEVPVGKNHHGIIYHDFEKYCHLLNGGTTRFGKTVFLKGVFTTLLLSQWENVEFYILDLKGGLEFYKYRKLPQVKAVATDLIEAADLLEHIIIDLKKKEKVFLENDWTNIIDTPDKKRTFIIVDEGAELAPGFCHPKFKKHAEYCQLALGEISRIGGGLGYRQLYCTQYPVKAAVSMQVRINTVTRISFTVPEQVASMVLLDEPGAEDLPAHPGRAIYKVDKMRTLQVPLITDQQSMEWIGGKWNEQTGKDRAAAADNRPFGNGQYPPAPKDSRTRRV